MTYQSSSSLRKHAIHRACSLAVATIVVLAVGNIPVTSSEPLPSTHHSSSHNTEANSLNRPTLVPNTPEHKTYHVYAGFAMHSDIADPGLNEYHRDNVANRSRFRAPLGDWAKPKGWTHHVDVVREEMTSGGMRMVGYFWYQTVDGGTAKCVRRLWTGSSNRTPFHNVFELAEGAQSIGVRTMKGFDTECYHTEHLPGYGPVTQCYRMGENTIPMTFESTGECCPGANRFDFYSFEKDVVIPDSVFDVPKDCTDEVEIVPATVTAESPRVATGLSLPLRVSRVQGVSVE
eukprot:GFYU01006159.1.p1 GENE.GFYU01006159.1~~GFYU01006159.1.p1  ORF type:complete len:289 (+),score=44.20 GFYU01006159.1:102-968(+)